MAYPHQSEAGFKAQGSSSSSSTFQPATPHSAPFDQPPPPNQQYATPPTPPTESMRPPQRPFQSIPNLSAGPPANTSTGASSTPPTNQSALRPPPLPASSMTAVTHQSSAQSTPTSDTTAIGKPPATPKSAKLPPEEQERVSALLALNTIILRELQSLQTLGAAASSTQPSPQQNPSQPRAPDGAPTSGEPQKSPPATASTPTTTTPTPQTPKMTKPTPKQIFDNYLKRLQVNIAYLLALSQGKPVPPHPLAMEPPPDAWSMPAPGEAGPPDAEEKGKEVAQEFRDAYQLLKKLWPNYKPGVKPPQAAGQQQLQQGQHQQVIPGQPSQTGKPNQAQVGMGLVGQAQAPTNPQMQIAQAQQQQQQQMGGPQINSQAQLMQQYQNPQQQQQQQQNSTTLP